MIKAYLTYVREYVKEQFHLGLYSSVIVLLSVLLVFNYAIEFEDTVMDSYYGKPIQFFYYFLFQGIPYFFTCFLVGLFKPKLQFWKKKEFWLMSLLGISIISFDRSFYLHHLLLDNTIFELRYYLLKLVSNMREIVTILTPLVLFYFFYDIKYLNHFYGLRLKGVSFGPYLLMMVMMAGGVYLASLNESFLSHYPVYGESAGVRFAEYLRLNEITPFMLFEVVYGFSFVMVELVFRGFLIIGLVRYFGDDVVLPMAVTYCVLHFGKPLGESISSVFGAYILGIIALKSKNIWGGVFVHAGIAVLMDVFAFYA